SQTTPRVAWRPTGDPSTRGLLPGRSRRLRARLVFGGISPEERAPRNNAIDIVENCRQSHRMVRGHLGAARGGTSRVLRHSYGNDEVTHADLQRSVVG